MGQGGPSPKAVVAGQAHNARLKADHRQRELGAQPFWRWRRKKSLYRKLVHARAREEAARKFPHEGPERRSPESLRVREDGSPPKSRITREERASPEGLMARELLTVKRQRERYEAQLKRLSDAPSADSLSLSLRLEIARERERQILATLGGRQRV